MAITATDIQFRLSGGASNSDVNASLGGAKSSTQITDATLHNLFDQVSGGESAAGDIEYRCIYVHNAHGSLTLQNAVVWISTNTPSTDTTVAIALAGEGLNATAETVANENTAPAGESFTSPSSKGTGLSLGNIPAGQHYAIWIRRTVTAGAAAYNTDSVILSVEGDTANDIAIQWNLGQFQTGSNSRHTNSQIPRLRVLKEQVSNRIISARNNNRVVVAPSG